MKLRELINCLEELSENGKNDNMIVKYDDSYNNLITINRVSKGQITIILNEVIEKLYK